MGILDGRVAIVTGGGRGIGRAHSFELARHGAIVVVNDVGAAVGGDVGPGQESPAAVVAREIVDAGGLATADATSVTSHDAVGELVQDTMRAHGRLDVVVNNAGILRDSTIVNMSEEDWAATLDVHLNGTFNVVKHALAHWRAASKSGQPVSGRIINTTSGAGLFGNLGQANYAAAKAGIANLTVVAAMEAERYGVTANAISPIARTRMTERLVGDAPSDGWDPLDPANSSPVVAWLASEASGWLTGAVLRVEGDTVLRMRPWAVDPTTSFRSRSGERLRAEELDRGMRLAYRTAPSGTPPIGADRA